MPRYRMILDIEDQPNNLTNSQLKEISEEVKSKVTLALTPEQKRNGISIEVIDQKHSERTYHHHVGADCYGCYVQKDDNLGT